MEVSPKTFREVEFREKLRGYHPEDVDQFLEQMASGVEVLQDKLHQALERAQRAEARAAESGGNDETLRRTLVLAQRTADQAVQEARDQASRIVGAAEQKAQTMLAEAEERARRLHNEALADVRSELTKLEATRAHSQQEVDALERWADEQRGYLVASLQDALTVLERGGLTSPPPSSTPLEVPRAPGSRPATSVAAAQAEPTAPAAPSVSGP
jgi:cell division initiation protein